MFTIKFEKSICTGFGAEDFPAQMTVKTYSIEPKSSNSSGYTKFRNSVGEYEGKNNKRPKEAMVGINVFEGLVLETTNGIGTGSNIDLNSDFYVTGVKVKFLPFLKPDDIYLYDTNMSSLSEYALRPRKITVKEFLAEDE